MLQCHVASRAGLFVEVGVDILSKAVELLFRFDPSFYILLIAAARLRVVEFSIHGIVKFPGGHILLGPIKHLEPIQGIFILCRGLNLLLVKILFQPGASVSVK